MVAEARQKILVIGPAWIGDMVMTQALLKLLKQRQPEVLLDVLATAWNQAVVKCMPEVNQVFVSPFQHGEFRLRDRYAFARRFRDQYQQVIVIPNSFKSALIPFFARIPQRTGWRGEMRWQLLNDVRYLDKTKLPMMMQRYMALGMAKSEMPVVTPELRPQLRIPAAEITEALQRYSLSVDNGRPVVALCPGAERGPARRWPAEYYADIARKTVAQGGQVWLFGSAKDQPITDSIAATVKSCVNLAGKTNLTDAIYLISAVTAVITNDSGLMHIAGALNKPLLAIYGSTPPEIAPPMSDDQESFYLNLNCSPCFARECPLGHYQCLRDINPAQVMQSLHLLLTNKLVVRGLNNG